MPSKTLKNRAARFEDHWRAASDKYNKFIKDGGDKSDRRGQRLFKDMLQKQEQYVNAARATIGRGGKTRRRR
jgi:hypothetical protein